MAIPGIRHCFKDADNDKGVIIIHMTTENYYPVNYDFVKVRRGRNINS